MMPGVDPRQMATMMRRMGIQVDEIDGVQEVVVRTAAKEYRFRKASVTVMKAQGTETWQVQGKPEVVERAGAAPAPGSKPAPSGATPVAAQAEPLPILDEDVRLVMEQAKVDERTARRALEAAAGDLAEALVRLQQ